MIIVLDKMVFNLFRKKEGNNLNKSNYYWDHGRLYFLLPSIGTGFAVLNSSKKTFKIRILIQYDPEFSLTLIISIDRLWLKRGHRSISFYPLTLIKVLRVSTWSEKNLTPFLTKRDGVFVSNPKE
jgi:hypothetical protein